MKSLLISMKDMAELTSFSGNIDADAMNPSINIAQNGDVRNIFGKELIDKIIDDKKNNTLAGVYKTIFEDYLQMILVFKTAAHYMRFGGYKTANQGIFKTTADGQTSVDYKEVLLLVNAYDAQSTVYEGQFYSFISDNPIPEYTKTGTNSRITKIIKWY